MDPTSHHRQSPKPTRRFTHLAASTITDHAHRQRDQEPEPNRTPFMRDRDRILHSQAFRRLQFKTQVFLPFQDDHYRTRLTHTLEVAQIARSMAVALGVDEGLTEAIALAHDLGHPPFGHAGEYALDQLMQEYGGFNHNEQVLRIITELEHRYFAFDGLNLTRITLDGIIKHNGPLGLSRQLAWTGRLCHEFAIQPARQPVLEAQLATIADDIAYLTHDIEDGVRAGLFCLAEIADMVHIRPVWRDVEHIRRERPDRLTQEFTRRLIASMIGDVLGETEAQLRADNIDRAEQVREANRAMAGFSTSIQESIGQLRRFLFARVYRHWQVNRDAKQARRIVTELFTGFMAEPETLPDSWQQAANLAGRDKARIIADYIAGMTDRFAILEHEKMFSPKMLLDGRIA